MGKGSGSQKDIELGCVSLNILETINGHADLQRLNEHDREQLCREIREFLVEHISKTGGHLASNLGVVELSVAIETVFDTQKDRLVFDVGHQSYIHKILTGRRDDFVTLRQYNGIAGFPKPAESDCDAFVAGHASSSVSIALGMARARTLRSEDYQVIAFMGDGAATGGMAYEGLNNAAVSNEPMVVILNDNAMSIDRNVGGMASHLSKLRTKEKYLGMKQKYRSFLHRVPGGNVIFNVSRKVKDILRRALIPTTIFESMGFTYLGPVDGHDLEGLISLLRIAKDMKRPVLIHALTQKGKGYGPAEEHPKLFHGVGSFDPITGEVPQKDTVTFSEAFGSEIVRLAEEDGAVCALTAAMPGGTGLLEFKKKFPQRLFDVGIAEEHAVSMAGGLAKQGMTPVVAIYSTFLQRAFDMMMQDVALLKLHVVFAVDRAGLVGEDGETHHGVFDVGYLRLIPGMMVLCPANTSELRDMLRWAVRDQNGPVAIRYPRGADGILKDSAWNAVSAVCKQTDGDDAVIITYGTLTNQVLESAQILRRNGINITVIRLLAVNPLPIRELLRVLPKTKHVFVAEEVCAGCGISEEIAAAVSKERPDIKIGGFDLGPDFVPHGKVQQLYKQRRLDAESMAQRILEVLKVED